MAVTVNGAWAAAAFILVAILCIGMAWRGSWRDEMARIREAAKPAEPFVDYDAYHSSLLPGFLDCEERKLLASLKGDPS